MYKSLKPWMNIPFSLKPFVRHTGTGAKEFGEPVEHVCYPDSLDKVVSTKEGKDVVSTTQLYVGGGVPIKQLDNVIFEGNETEVKAVGCFYRSGKIDLKVVYL